MNFTPTEIVYTIVEHFNNKYHVWLCVTTQMSFIRSLAFIFLKNLFSSSHLFWEIFFIISSSASSILITFYSSSNPPQWAKSKNPLTLTFGIHRLWQVHPSNDATEDRNSFGIFTMVIIVCIKFKILEFQNFMYLQAILEKRSKAQQTLKMAKAIVLVNP